MSNTDRAVGDRTFKILNAAHQAVVKLSFGKLGWKLARMEVVELTTIGRKSGEKRTVMLTSPMKEGDAWVVVASRYGDTKHPDWFLNLQANPSVEITVRGKRSDAVARIATDAERDDMWPRAVAVYKNYAGYQEKTERVIPMVFLTPT
jgi:deazaflavin-dependent oxidoreductase (nitroreductase family)